MIGQGCARPSEIAARLQVPQTALGRPLKRLMQLGLVFRDVPFGNEGPGNKKTFYVLADSFLRFWYTFALPHYSNAAFGAAQADIESLCPAFRVFLGQAWETLVREILAWQTLPGDATRWERVGRWWGSGLNRMPMEVDVVAESADCKTLLVGECKLALTAAEAKRVQAELETKARLLPFASSYKRVVTRLFVAEGGSFDCVDLRWCEEAPG